MRAWIGVRRQRVASRKPCWNAAAGLALLLVASGLACERRPPAGVREEIHFPKAEAARLAGDHDAAIAGYLRSIRAAPQDPRPYYGLVQSHARRGNLDAAASILDSMLAADPRNACVHYGLGCLAVRLQDLPAALEAANRAVDLDPRLGHARLLLGSIHYHAGEPQDALEAWDEARRIFRKQRDRKYEAWARNMMALVRRELSDFRGALAEFEEAFRLQRGLDDRQAQQVVLGNIGLTQTDLGDLVGAEAAFRQALALAREVGDRDGECWHLSNLSFVHNLAGQNPRAIEYADSAITLAHDMGRAEDEVAGLLSRASAAMDLGDPISALKACYRALPIADSLADARHRAGVLLTLGRANTDLGRLDRARSGYLLSDSLFREIGAESGSWEALIGLCEVSVREGDSTRAIARAESTLRICAKAGYAEGEEFLALFLSGLKRERGDLGGALALSTRAVDLSRRDGRRKHEALALARRARVRLALGDPAGAADDASEAREIAREIQSPEVGWECEMVRGDIDRETDPGGALAHYEAAMDAVEAIQRELRLEEFKAAYLAGRMGLYYKAADLLVSLGRDRDAFAVCERSRARAFRDLLASCPKVISPHVARSLASRNVVLEERLQALRASVSRMAAAPAPDRDRIRTLEREIARAKREWEDVRARILLEDPRYGTFVAGAWRPEPEDVLQAIGTDVAMIVYALGPHASLCFVVRDGNVRATRLNAGSAAVAEEVEALRRPLHAPWSLATLAFDVGRAMRLRAEIFDPIAPLVNGVSRLVIVPDGALNYLPFEMLVLPADRDDASDALYGAFRRTTFLGDRYAVQYLSAASLAVPFPVADPSRAGGRSPRTLLAMGCPTEMGSALRDTEWELRAIGKLFSDAIVGVGPAATEGRFKTLAPQFRFVHISSHGTVDEEAPLYSSLRLSPDSSGVEDGILHAYEVLSLSLDCDLVALSACETGLGRLYAGEGLLGLTRAFIYAGARQALVGLWRVNDASTAILMERFYANLARGLDPAEALQQAKRALREMVVPGPGGRRMSYAHPFFWAPFVLTGTLSDR